MGNVQMVPFEAKMKDFGGLLQRMAPQLKNALPRHVRTDKFIRTVLTAVRKNPDILACSEGSVLGSVVTSAQLGLELDGVLGEAYLVPYKGECQLIVGYQGFIKLAWQSGMVEDVYAEIVYEKDVFKWSLGTDRRIVHKPSDDIDREKGKITHVYAAVKIKGGGTPFVVLTIAAVEKLRERSRAKTGPWFTDYEAMVKKTAVRQLQKWIPKSKEQARAAALDEMADSDLSQGMGSVIDVRADVPGADEDAPPEAPKEGVRVSLKAPAASKPATPERPVAITDDKKEPVDPDPDAADRAAAAPTADEIAAYEAPRAPVSTRGPRALPRDDADDLPSWGGGKGKSR